MTNPRILQLSHLKARKGPRLGSSIVSGFRSVNLQCHLLVKRYALGNPKTLALSGMGDDMKLYESRPVVHPEECGSSDTSVLTTVVQAY